MTAAPTVNPAASFNTLHIVRRIQRTLFAAPIFASLAAVLIAPSASTALLLVWMCVLFTPALIWPRPFAWLYGKGLIALSVLGMIVPSTMRDPFETAGQSGLDALLPVIAWYAAMGVLCLVGIGLMVMDLLIPLFRRHVLHR